MPTSTKSSKCLHDIIYPNSKYDLLDIPHKQWLEAYNYDFIPYLETLKHNGARYVSWSYAKKFLIEFFNGKYDVAYEQDPKTQNYYFTDGNCKDKHPYIKAFIYDTKSFARSDASYYPIMDRGNKPCVGLPDNMTLNKNLKRAGVKVIADVTGFGLRAWSGEDFDSDKPQMLLKMRQLNDEYMAITGESHEEYRKAHFGLSSDQLVKIGKQMAADVTGLQSEYGTEDTVAVSKLKETVNGQK